MALQRRDTGTRRCHCRQTVPNCRLALCWTSTSDTEMVTMVIAQSSNEHPLWLMGGGESEVRRVATRSHETIIGCLLILGLT